jgi:Protein of unknown function (DUF1670)
MDSRSNFLGVDNPYYATWLPEQKPLVYRLGSTPEVHLMIRTKSIEDQLRQGRLDAKTLDSMFRRRIEDGANCSPFVSKAILATVKEVFPIGPDEADHQLGLGQIQLLVVSALEPAGKPMELCQKVTVRLTLDAGQDDFRVRLAYGVEGLRRARILRLTAEARDQGGLLSYEDLAFRLFNCGVRTIVRDVQALHRRELEVPSRGQQQDIGPGQTHRVQAVRLFLLGHQPNEIARRLYHTLGSIENYIKTRARCVISCTLSSPGSSVPRSVAFSPTKSMSSTTDSTHPAADSERGRSCGRESRSTIRRLVTNASRIPASCRSCWTVEDRGEGPQVTWHNEPVPITVDRALRPRSSPAGEEEQAFLGRESDQWLREMLDAGPVLYTDILNVGRTAGFTRDTLRRAKERIGATAYRDGFGPGSRFYWRLTGASSRAS